MLTNQSRTEGPSRSRAAANAGSQRTASRAAAAHPGNATPATLGLMQSKADGHAPLLRQMEEEEEAIQAMGMPQMDRREGRSFDHPLRSSHLISVPKVSESQAEEPKEDKCTAAANSVAQLYLHPWKQPGGALNVNQNLVRNDATTIDNLTTAAYNNTRARLNAAINGVPPTPLNINQFPGVTQNNLAFFVQVLQRNNNSLKAAVAGRVIEDQVSFAQGLPAAAARQQPRQNAILDFIITHGPEEGVVDITSSGEVGHVRDKNYNEGPFAFIWESIYPSINFNNLAGAPLVGVALTNAIQASLRRRANSYIMHRKGVLRTNLLLFERGIMRRSQNRHIFRAAAQQAMNRFNALPGNAVWTAVQVANIDNDILNVNNTLPVGVQPQEDLSHMINTAQNRYGVIGNPRW